MKTRVWIFIIVLLLVCSGVWWFFYESRTGYKEIRNVLLISIDTCRSDYLSCYGYPQQTTPNIDALAKDAFLFENAITPIPTTLPAHSSMLTGTIPPHHGVHDNSTYVLAESNITMAEVLKDNGFTTAAVISAFVLDSQFGINQGFDSYNDDFEEEHKSVIISYRKGTEASRKAVDWLETHKDEKFFFFLHYFDPHADYEPPEPFATQYHSNPYAGEIAYTDHCIGQVIQKLKDLELYDSTLIIITADHGEMLGEHGEETHSYFIYESAIKIPLIIHLPGQRSGKRISDRVSLVDIAPTVYRQTGTEVTHQMQGEDLSGYFAGQAPDMADRYIYCESMAPTRYLANSLLGVLSADWKYIQTTRPELYKLSEDPGELSNLAPSQPQRVRIMRDRLREILQKVSRQDSGSGSKLDAETRRRLESLGYVASSGVSEEFDFDQTKDDPKDLIDFNNSCGRLIALNAAKMYDEARSLCKEMIAVRPSYARAYYDIALIALREKDYAGAVPYLYETIKRDPGHYKAHLILGSALLALDKEEKALKSFDQALRLAPDDAEAHAEVHNVTGAAMMEQGKYTKALKSFDQAFRLSPGNPEILYNMATTLKNLGKDDQSQTLESLANALHQRPDDPELLNRTGLALMSFGKYEEAIKCFEKLLSQQPDNAPVLNNLAWAKAVYPNTAFHDPNDAVQLAERACELKEFKEPEILDTLSVAYAAAGRFTQAAESAEKAIELYTSSGRPDLAENIRKHLELYKEQKPYYEELPQNL